MKTIFEAILGVQPKQGGGAGESRESVVCKLADDMLKKLPQPYVSFEVLSYTPYCNQFFMEALHYFFLVM